MKYNDNIEKTVKNFCAAKKSTVKTTTEMDQRIISDALQTQKKSTSAKPQPNIWRTIIKTKITKITKLASAAAVIMTVGVGIYFFAGSSNSRSIAWAQVEKALEGIDWMHLIYQAHSNDDADQSRRTTWLSFASKVRISEYFNNGGIDYSNYSTGIKYLYDPSKDTITISNIPDQDFVLGASNPVELFSKIIKMEQEKEGRVVIEKLGKYKHTKVKIWEDSESKGNVDIKGKLFADVKNGLPVAVAIAVTRNSEVIQQMNVEFEYPKTGPEDIYQAGAPRSASVINSD